MCLSSQAKMKNSRDSASRFESGVVVLKKLINTRLLKSLLILQKLKHTYFLNNSGAHDLEIVYESSGFVVMNKQKKFPSAFSEHLERMSGHCFGFMACNFSILVNAQSSRSIFYRCS